jgi:hypothetical protein
MGGYFDARAAPGGALDPSGLVKGWSVEAASALLAGSGTPNHCINAGGDVRIRGRPGPGRLWHVGLSHPFHPGAFTAVVGLTGGAVATSGTAERGLHVFNPHTGRPAAELASVTISGPASPWPTCMRRPPHGCGSTSMARQPRRLRIYVVDAGATPGGAPASTHTRRPDPSRTTSRSESWRPASGQEPTAPSYRPGRAFRRAAGSSPVGAC